MSTLDLAAGTARDFLLQARDAAGNTFTAGTTPFLGTDTLAAAVWAGADTATLFAPAVTWADAAVGTFTVALVASDTAAVAAGTYRLRVTVTRAGKTGVLFDGRLRVAPSPGSGSAPLAFTARADLLAYAPWLEDLQSDGDEASFAGEQARATNRLIDALCSTWKPSTLGVAIGQPGWNAQTLFGAGAPPSKWLRDQLVPLRPNSSIPASMAANRTNSAANLVQPRVSTGLLLYDEVLEICAKWAITYVCQAQIGRNEEKAWRALARMFHADADGLFRCRRFEIDLSNPQTGWASITVDGGSGSLR